MPKVSIIIPCYNEQSTIRLLLDALRNQTFPYADAEVIISDGMSTDDTRAEIALFQKDNPDLAVRVGIMRFAASHRLSTVHWKFREARSSFDWMHTRSRI
jgi:glycosyltransferase involved in cell wall biosynthesis